MAGDREFAKLVLLTAVMWSSSLHAEGGEQPIAKETCFTVERRISGEYVWFLNEAFQVYKQKGGRMQNIRYLMFAIDEQEGEIRIKLYNNNEVLMREQNILAKGGGGAVVFDKETRRVLRSSWSEQPKQP